jgi:hypothetical protein
LNALLLTGRILLGVTGGTEILLGTFFWTGRGLTLVPVHMGIGVAFVLSLWLLAILGTRAHVGAGILVVTGVWGFVVLVLGATQMTLLPGPLHWLVQVTHLLVGLVAMGLGVGIYRRIRRAETVAGQQLTDAPFQSRGTDLPRNLP